MFSSGTISSEKSLLRLPVVVQSGVYQMHVRNPKMSAKIGNSVSHAANRKNATVSGVISLLNNGGPFAVGRFVIAVVIDAVNAVLIARALPHVVNKVLKIKPSLTDFNATPAITGVLGYVGVCAASRHDSPNPVDSRVFLSPSGVSMFDSVTFMASTCRRTAVSKVVNCYKALSATLASAKNVWNSVTLTVGAIFRFADNSPLAEYGADGQYFGRHSIASFNVVLRGRNQHPLISASLYLGTTT